MKKPWLAFLLSFLLAGAGFAYLGKWGWAVLNLAAALAVGVVIALYAPNLINMAYIVVPVINASLAMSFANSMNAKLKLQVPPTQPPPTGQ